MQQTVQASTTQAQCIAHLPLHQRSQIIGLLALRGNTGTRRQAPQQTAAMLQTAAFGNQLPLHRQPQALPLHRQLSQQLAAVGCSQGSRAGGSGSADIRGQNQPG